LKVEKRGERGESLNMEIPKEIKPLVDVIGRKWGYYLARNSVASSMREASKDLRKRSREIRQHKAESLELFLEGQLSAERFKEIANQLIKEHEEIKEQISLKEQPYRKDYRRLNKLYNGLRKREFMLYQQLFGEINPLKDTHPADKDILAPKKRKRKK